MVKKKKNVFKRGMCRTYWADFLPAVPRSPYHSVCWTLWAWAPTADSFKRVFCCICERARVREWLLVPAADATPTLRNEDYLPARAMGWGGFWGDFMSHCDWKTRPLVETLSSAGSWHGKWHDGKYPPVCLPLSWWTSNLTHAHRLYDTCQMKSFEVTLSVTHADSPPGW